MIRRMRLKNFRHYVDETFEFPEGATFIEGENNAGKTTIFYAIEYALFGNVAQFKSPGALLRPKAGAGGVEMDFEGIDGRSYRLQRIHARPPRSRTKVTGHYTLLELRDDASVDAVDEPNGANEDSDGDGSTVEPSGRYLLSSDFQDHEEKLALKIAELLGISKRMFELAISTRQSETARILAGTPKLDIVLGITAVALAEEEFRSMALQREKQCKALPLLEDSLQRVEEDLEKSRARAAALDKERQTLETQRQALQKQREDVALALCKVQSLQADLDQLGEIVDQVRSLLQVKATLAERQESLGNDYGNVDTLERQQRRAEKARSAAEKQMEKDSAEIQALRTNLREVDQQMGDLSGRIDRRGDLADDATRCETCGQTIDPERARKELATWKAEYDALIDRQQELQQQIQQKEEAIEESRLESQSHREQIAESKRLLEEWQTVQRRQEEHRKEIEETTPHLQQACDRVTEAAAAFQPINESLELSCELIPRSSPQADQAEEILSEMRGPAAKIATAIEVKSAQCEAESESNTTMQQRQEIDRTELAETQAELARESARLQQEVELLRSEKEHAATLRLCSKAFQELQQRLREQAADSLATNTLALHRELSHTDEFTKLTIDPANYAVQVKAKDYNQLAPAALFQGGGHRVLLGLAFKLAVAQMVGHCPFLLLDEPTDGLDEVHRQQLMERLGSVQVTRQMLVITHQGTEQESGHRIRIQRIKNSSKQV